MHCSGNMIPGSSYRCADSQVTGDGDRSGQSKLTEMDAIDGRDVDVRHAFTRREALDQLRHRLVQAVKPGRTDRFDQAVALAAAGDV